MDRVQRYGAIATASAQTIRWLVLLLAITAGALALVTAESHFSNWSFLKDRIAKDIAACDMASPPDVCKTLGGTNKLRAQQTAYESLENETINVRLPIIGYTLCYSDFQLALGAIGLFVLRWLSMNLGFARNTLCNFFNGHMSAGDSDGETIPASFLLLWPGGARYQNHAVIKFVFVAFWIALATVVASDIYETYYRHRSGIPLAAHPGWEDFRGYMILRETALGIMLLLTIRECATSWRRVRDVRNILMLIEWRGRALAPALCTLAELESARKGMASDENGKVKLHVGFNEISYEESLPGTEPRWETLRSLLLGARSQYRLVFRLKFVVPAGAGKDGSCEFRAPVDLWESASHFLSKGFGRPAKVTESNDYRYFQSWMDRNDPSYDYARDATGRKSTLVPDEDRRMQVYFFNLLTNASLPKAKELVQSARGAFFAAKWAELVKQCDIHMS